ncbi:hypothetical protein N7457_005155 [Penicillium paradoxum]|uniref:uncharacterized protein n=1 Tax=Penicillium paradoxum TaxID=176176 RepID=UPI002547E9E3|nr:uncharacterized protein N7457_005155 [Penicillium paradoxum]KAJ5779995.1 hypothetical protein N7457_005155 [Penicillium paradoxum]
MHLLTTQISLLLAVSATLVAAQDGTPTSANTNSNSYCASQKLVDSCVAAMKVKFTQCSESDWDCKCSGAANIANCYVDCSDDDPARSAAQVLSMNDCATANAYDVGLTTVAPSWTRPGSNAAQPTETDYTIATTTATPTPTLSAHEKSTSPSEGAAAANSAGSWLALVGLGLGIAF